MSEDSKDKLINTAQTVLDMQHEYAQSLVDLDREHARGLEVIRRHMDSMLADKNKRIAALEAALRMIVEELDNLESHEWEEVVASIGVTARKALNG